MREFIILQKQEMYKTTPGRYVDVVEKKAPTSGFESSQDAPAPSPS